MKGRGIERRVRGVRSRRKCSGNLPSGEIKRKERLITNIMTRNYQQKLSEEIMRRNYQLVYYVVEKCGNYRDTGVSKNVKVKLSKLTMWLQSGHLSSAWRT